MAVTGEQIRKEQEESRRRSQFGKELVAEPTPPPWDSYWREEDRKFRHFWLILPGAAPVVAVATWYAPDNYALLPLFLYGLLAAFLGNRLVPICPRCGHRFNSGRWARSTCQHCGLKHRQSNDDRAAITLRG